MKEFRTPPELLREQIRIALVGLGGTGSEMLAILRNMAITLDAITDGKTELIVEAWDGDHVSAANIGRQGFYSGDIGFNKAETLISRTNMFYGLRWIARPSHYPTEAISNSCDLLISCTDSARFRAKLAQSWQQQNRHLLWLDTGNGQFSGQVVLGHLGSSSKKTLPNVFDLFPELDSMLDDDEPSCSTAAAIAKQDLMVNRMAATWAGTLLWNLIRHGCIQEHGVIFDIRKMQSLPIRIDPLVWQSMGFQAPWLEGAVA